ncbi:hypothetical protein JL722_910 [Aureococcus anophagefferens]|nr:hypothetical protein JL722_910 [Aureococcus anophagefferens]
MALPVVAKRDVAASWLAELDCIGGTLKKLGGSGASEAQKGTAKRRSVFSRAPQWKSRLFWVEIAAPAAGENYVLQYGDAKRKPKGAFALEGATVDAVADADGDFRLHARVGRAWVTVTLRAPTGRERGVWMRTLAHVADVATRRGAAEGSTRAAERERGDAAARAGAERPVPVAAALGEPAATDGQLACAELAAVHFDKALLERLDGDGDGFLSVDEFVHFFGDAVEGERDEKKTAKLLREGIELVGRVLAWRQKQKDRLHAAALRAHNAALAKHAAELAAAKKESRAAKRESRALKARLSAAPGEVLEADDDEPSASDAVAQRRSVFARIEEDSSDEAEPPQPADTDSYSDEAEPPPVLARPAAAPGKPVAARGVTRSPGKHKRTRAHFAPSASEANVLVAPIEAPRPPPAAEAVEEEAARTTSRTRPGPGPLLRAAGADASTFYGAPPAARKRASTKPPARVDETAEARGAGGPRAPGAAAHAARERQRADGAGAARARYVADLELEARVIDRLRAAVAAEDAATLADLLALVRRLHRRATANREEAVRRPGVAARTRWICAGVEQQCALEERRLAAALPAPAVAAAGDEENVPAAYAPKTPRPGCGGRDAPWSLL